MKKMIVLILMLMATIVFADQSEALKKELVDIKGWEAGEAEGMSMDMGGMKMVNAVREYTNGDKEFLVTVIIGTNTLVTGQMPQMNVENEEGIYQTDKINGMDAYQAYDKEENAGAIIVDLGKSETDGGFLMFSFENMKPEEALKLSKDFDWKKIKESSEIIMNKK
ncbi:MAG: hypothetical protein JXR69_01875 [Candidatus Delongbacteria bacterium]|nr:hypothetical protein [Candidatus Delongbacteria bacterium]